MSTETVTGFKAKLVDADGNVVSPASEVSLDAILALVGKQTRTLLSAPIAATLSGDNEVVPAVVGMRIYVVSYKVIAAGSVGVKWRSGTTDLEGVNSLLESSGAAVVGAPVSPLFWTGLHESLNLNLSAARSVAGHMTYFLEADA